MQVKVQVVSAHTKQFSNNFFIRYDDTLWYQSIYGTEMMILNRSFKNQKDFFFHWKIVLPIWITVWYIANFELRFLLFAFPVILLYDILPSLYLIRSFNKQSPFLKIKFREDCLELFNNSDELTHTLYINEIYKMIGYKPGNHPSHKKWFPFIFSCVGFQHVEIELNDGRVLNITSLYDENIDSIIKQIKPEVYEEKMGVPYIRRKNTFP